MFSPYASMKRRVKVQEDDLVIKPLPESQGLRFTADCDEMRKIISESLSLDVAWRKMTANQLEVRVRRMCFDAGMPADCVLGGYHVTWNPKTINLKEI